MAALLIFGITLLYLSTKGRHDESYKGIITKKLKTSRGRWFEIRLASGVLYESYTVSDSVFKVSDVGDTVIKRKGDIQITIKKTSPR